MHELIPTLNRLSAAATPLVITAVWQSTLLAVVVATMAHALRRSSPALRYWLWQIVAIKLLVVPFWSITLPASWSIVPATGATQSESAPTGLAEVTADDRPREDFGSSDVPRTRLDSAAVPVAIGHVDELTWASWLLLGWALVVALEIGQLAVQRRRLSLLLAQSSPAGAELLAATRQVADGLRLRRVPKVLLTTENCSPFVQGAIRPTLVLSRTLLATLSSVELRQVLSHELAHIKRRDLVWSWLPQIVRMLYFFHPVAHWCQRRVRLERELACDQMAMRVGGDRPEEYVQTLVRVVSHISLPAALVGVAAPVVAVSYQERTLP